MKYLIVGILLVMGVLACSSNKMEKQAGKTNSESLKQKNVVHPTNELKKSAADTLIQMYNSGGFTGMTTGYWISTRGEIKRFVKNVQGQVVDEQRKALSPDTVRLMIRELQQTGVLANPIRRTGNFTHYLIVRFPEQTISLSWVDKEELPVSFQQWYEKYWKKCSDWLPPHNR